MIGDVRVGFSAGVAPRGAMRAGVIVLVVDKSPVSAEVSCSNVACRNSVVAAVRLLLVELDLFVEELANAVDLRAHQQYGLHVFAS
jgi:hypothetical protein